MLTEVRTEVVDIVQHCREKRPICQLRDIACSQKATAFEISKHLSIHAKSRMQLAAANGEQRHGYFKESVHFVGTGLLLIHLKGLGFPMESRRNNLSCGGLA